MQGLLRTLYILGKNHKMRFFLLVALTLGLCMPSGTVGAQTSLKLGTSEQKPKWYENIVAESHGYHWFTNGNVTHRHLWDGGGLYGFSHLKYNTDSNLYIIGGEAGYRFGLPFLKRITLGLETSQGSSDTMHGTDSDPAFSDPGRTNFLGYDSYQRHSGGDSTKYMRPALYIRPIEGKITNEVNGYFDILGEWIRYKDRVHIARVADVIPGTSGIFEADNPFKTRYEGAGVGFRGGLGFFKMFKLEGLFVYYPDMSTKRTLLWDVPINRKFVFFGKDETGVTGRVTLGLTPPIGPLKERKNLEIELGYQYMEFKQDGGRGRVFRFSDGASANIDNWDRARNKHDGFFIGGTLRW